MKKIQMIGIKAPQRVHNIPGPTPVPKSTPAPKEKPIRIDREIPAPNWPTREKTPATPAPKREKVYAE